MPALYRISEMLQLCDDPKSLMPATFLYNEGWLLRLVLDWFSRQQAADHEFTFTPRCRWFTEGLLPSRFLAQKRGDPLAESWTHADGIIGHFKVGRQGKTDVSIDRDATQFIVTEAKMMSGLSSGVSNARYFDQAARNVACMAEALLRADRKPKDFHRLAFYVVAPESQISLGIFAKHLERDAILKKVRRRVAEYKGDEKINFWFDKWFSPTWETIEIRALSWEEVIRYVVETDDEYGKVIKMFYEKCLVFNSPN